MSIEPVRGTGALPGRRIEAVTLNEASAHGQRLFIAGTWRPAHTPRHRQR